MRNDWQIVSLVSLVAFFLTLAQPAMAKRDYTADALRQVDYYDNAHAGFSLDSLLYYASKPHDSEYNDVIEEIILDAYSNLGKYESIIARCKRLEKDRYYYYKNEFLFPDYMADAYKALGKYKDAIPYYDKLLQKTKNVPYDLERLPLARKIIECYEKGLLKKDQLYYKCQSIVNKNASSTIESSKRFVLGTDTMSYYAQRKHFVAGNMDMDISYYRKRASEAYERIDKEEYYYKPLYLSPIIDLADFYLQKGDIKSAQKHSNDVAQILQSYWGVTDANASAYMQRLLYGDLKRSYPMYYPLVCHYIVCQRIDAVQSKWYKVQNEETILQELLSMEAPRWGKGNMVYDAMAHAQSPLETDINSPAFYITELRSMKFANDAYIAYKQHRLPQLRETLHQARMEYQNFYFRQLCQPQINTTEKTDNTFTSLTRQYIHAVYNRLGHDLYSYASLTQDKQIVNEAYLYTLFNKQLLLTSDTLLYAAHSREQKVLAQKRKNLYLQLGQSASLWKRDSILDQITIVERQLTISHFGDSTKIKQLLNVNTKDVSRQLNSTELALEFIRYTVCRDWVNSSSQIGTFVITPNSTQAEFVPIWNEQSLLLKGEPNKKNINAQYTYTYIANDFTNALKPYITNIKTLYFSPDGALNQVAIENCMFNAQERFADCYQCVRLSSTKEIANYKRRNQSMSSMGCAVLYGDINYGTVQAQYASTRTMRNMIEPLAFSKQEITGIEKALKKHSIAITCLSRQRGTEESVWTLDNTSPAILHFSTHSFSLSNDDALAMPYYKRKQTPYIPPMERCGLMLANAAPSLSGTTRVQSNDGILTAIEIAMLDLRNTKLAVLSACETALGDITSEGVWGLQRAFKMAGVQTIVMSLWQVDDEATSILMQYFYEELFRQPQSRFSPHAALASAQRRMRQHPQYSSPYYWAAFIAID